MEIPPGWYAISTAAEIPKGQPLGLRRFGLDLVLWAGESGEIIVMDDRCPHRGSKLSGGRTRRGTITCPYHGFEFSAVGHCVLVPETGRASPNLQVKTYASIVREGLLWVFHGDKKRSEEYSVPWFEDVTPDYCASLHHEKWATHITRCIENQLDYTHLAFVHKTTIGKNFNPARQVEFDLQMNIIGFKFSAQGPNTIEFRVPNIWINRISKNFKLVLFFAPVDNENTELYLISYQKFCTVPLARELVGLLLNETSKVILRQDRSVVLSQTPIDSTKSDENLYPGDKAIAHFRHIWRLMKLSPDGTS